jgi:hypothetical protein
MITTMDNKAPAREQRHISLTRRQAVALEWYRSAVIDWVHLKRRMGFESHDKILRLHEARLGELAVTQEIQAIIMVRTAEDETRNLSLTSLFSKSDIHYSII